MYENEKTEKADQAKTYYGELKGLAGNSLAVRANLRERVANSLHRAETEAGKAHACRELAQLLERNPEVARILELIEALAP